MRSAIVNTAVGDNYRLFQSVLGNTAKKHGVEAKLFSSYESTGSPHHKDCPYGFKIYSLLTVAAAGYDILIWCDSQIAIIRTLHPFIEHISKSGSAFFTGNTNVRRWTNRECLFTMDVSDEDAEKIPMLFACCFGLDIRDEKSKLFLSEWKRCAESGLFVGNREDHRWDQSCASILVNRLCMGKLIDYKSFFAPVDEYSLDQKPETIRGVTPETSMIRYYNLILPESIKRT
jgi:hypothetical protein